MRKEPKNIIPLTLTIDDLTINELTDKDISENLDDLDKTINGLNQESADGGFTKSPEIAEIVPPQISLPPAEKPHRIYEMDHLKNAIMPILVNKQNDILEELTKTKTIELYFIYLGFKITIERIINKIK